MKISNRNNYRVTFKVFSSPEISPIDIFGAIHSSFPLDSDSAEKTTKGNLIVAIGENVHPDIFSLLNQIFEKIKKIDSMAIMFVIVEDIEFGQKIQKSWPRDGLEIL